MKKIKYLLGLSILGLGLLINQSFGLTIDGVVLPWNNSSMASSVYKFDFNFTQNATNGTATPYYRFFGFRKFQNNSYLTDYSFCNSRWSSCSSLYSTIQLNSSIFSDVHFTGTMQTFSDRAGSYSVSTNMPMLSWGSSYDRTLRVLMGAGNNFGNNFVSIGEVEDGVQKPYYSFGSGYFTINDFVSLQESNINSYLRIFFEQNPINLSDPLKDYEINSNSGSNKTGSIARQYFTENGFRYQTKNQTSPKTFGDLGGSYKKGRYIGGYGMGYTFAIDTLNQGFIRWEDLSFVSVGSRCVQSLMEIGMSDPNSGTSSGCQQVGLLVLKGDSYVGFNDNASVIVLSKNPNNYSQVLYEQFDCAEDDLSRIFDSNYCTSIGHGYITIDGTGSVLPFNNQGIYYLGSGNKFIDFWLSSFNAGYISINGNQYVFNSLNGGNSVSFGLTSTPNNVSIKELYLDGLISGLPSITNPSDITDQMISNCKGPFYNTPDGLPPAYCSTLGTNFSGNCYTDFGVDSSGNIFQSLICADGEDYISNTNTWVVDESGNYVSYCTGDCDGNYIYYGSFPGTGDYFITTGYFDDFFNKTGMFFRCPYPYTQKLVIGKKLINLIDRDPFVPINCFIASYLAGKNNILFSSGLKLIDGGPLLKGTSDLSILLFRFFDFLICIGLILFVSKINKFFSH